eukprot:s501_g18.t2
MSSQIGRRQRCNCSCAAVLTLFASAWAFLRLPGRAPPVLRGSSLARRATESSTRRPLDAEDFRELLEQPDGASNIQSILKELLEDEGQLKEYNSTFQELAAAQEGAADSDPLAKFLSDPQAVWSWLQSNDKTQELMQIMQGSVLFDKLLKFGSEVLERRQVAELSEGSLVEISGLSAAEHLNGLTGTLSQATEEEMEEPGLRFQTARMESEHPGRRIIELEDGQGRIAVQPRNLIFPRHRPGDAVTLNAEFEPGTEHEGGPILQRILMWPEHLQRRPFQAGDGVLLRNLESDTTLNEAVIAMSAGKDAEAILRELLHSDQDAILTALRHFFALKALLGQTLDAVYAVGFSSVEGMPWVQAQAPDEILTSIRWFFGFLCLTVDMYHVDGRAQACPDLAAALEAAKIDPVTSQVVICGSLYLVADCVRLQRNAPFGSPRKAKI